MSQHISQAKAKQREKVLEELCGDAPESVTWLLATDEVSQRPTPISLNLVRNPTPISLNLVRYCHCQPSLQTIYASVSEPYTQLHLVGGRCRSSYVTSFLSFETEMARISLERRLSTTNSSSISWRLTMQWPEQSNRLFEKCDCEFLPMKHIGHACVHDGWQAGGRAKGKSNFGSYNSPPHPSWKKARHLFNTIAPILSNNCILVHSTWYVWHNGRSEWQLKRRICTEQAI